jgi:hypothetical protein
MVLPRGCKRLKPLITFNKPLINVKKMNTMNRYLAALLTFGATMIMATFTAILPSPGSDLMLFLWMIAVAIMVIWQEHKEGGDR